MNVSGLIRLLKTKVDNVWLDFVPENKSSPATSFTHIANSSSRLLKGSRTGVSDTWRVTVSSDSISDCEDEIAKIKELDNTKHDDFKRVFIIADGRVRKEPQDPINAMFVDIRTYEN